MYQDSRREVSERIIKTKKRGMEVREEVLLFPAAHLTDGWWVFLRRLSQTSPGWRQTNMHPYFHH